MNTPEGQENIPNPLEKFKEEVRRWKKEQLQKKSRGENYDPHAEEINPDYLTEDEMELWEKDKNQALTREDLKKYSEKAIARQRFEALMINRATYIVTRELNEKLKREGRQ